MELQENKIREKVQENFAAFTGLKDFDDETEVFGKNKAFFFMKVCLALDCRTKYDSCLKTLGEYINFFIKAIESKNARKPEFIKELQEFVKEITGNFYEPEEILLNEILPVTTNDPQQRVREQMNYWNKLGMLKNQLRKKYSISWDSEAFFYAKTINNFADVFFLKKYRED